MALLRIAVDFNATIQDGSRVMINIVHRPDLLESIKPGDRVILYEENDIEVKATIERQVDAAGHEWWYGVADWSTLRDL